MKIYTQEVPEEVVNYLEGLDYDVNALQNLIAFLGRSYEVNKELIKDYQNDYLQKFAEFEKAKQIFANDLGLGNSGANWSLDYATRIVTISYEEER
jgi:hypothetical protein